MASAAEALIDFVFDEDLVLSPTGELALTTSYLADPNFSDYRYQQMADQTIAILTNELQFHEAFGAKLDRYLGLTISSDLIEAGRRSILTTLKDLYPRMRINVEGYYMKAFKNSILYIVEYNGVPLNSVLVDLSGSINVFGV